MAWPISRISAISSCALPRVRPESRRATRLLLADGPDPARHALPAALVAHEGGDDHEQAPELDRVVDREHDARPERGAELARVLDGQAQVEVVGRDEAAGRAAQQDGLQVRRGPAGQLEQLAQRGPERHLVGAGRPDRARDAEQLGPGRLLGADLGEGRAALEHDRQDVDERLDVVDHRRLAEEPLDDRERRLVARLAAVALDRAEDRGLLAADVRAGALAHLDVEARSRGRGCPGRGSRARGPARPHASMRSLRERVLAAHVEVALLAAGGVGGDRHRLDRRRTDRPP